MDDAIQPRSAATRDQGSCTQVVLEPDFLSCMDPGLLSTERGKNMYMYMYVSKHDDVFRKEGGDEHQVSGLDVRGL